MRKHFRVAALALVIVPLWAAYQALTPAPASTPLSKLIPGGALLYLEAKDFSSLLRQWSASPESTTWLQSDNYQVFSRSRLFLRLADAQREFAAAAGLPPDMSFLSEVAGRQSAFAWYDIGKLEFLYITRNANAAPDRSALWQSRSKFESRSVAGIPFYIRTDAESHRVVAFAVTGDYLILATREDLIAGALQLIAGAAGRTIESEGWWSRSVAAAGPSGDLRMVLNLEAIVATPHFRSYWVQRNVTDMKQYTAAICDLYRSGLEYREERVLLRRAVPETPRAAAGSQAAADLAALVPAGAGVFRALADPGAEEALAAVAGKLIAPRAGTQPASRIAPRHVKPGSGETGGDFETRIDQPPPAHAAGGEATDPLKRILDSAAVTAMLELQSTTPDAGGVFVHVHSLVALSASADWRLPEVESAVTAALQPSLTAGQLGLSWRQNKAGYAELDGLTPMAIAIRGKQLFVSDDPALLAAVLASAPHKVQSQPAAYIAGFEHARERENFSRLAGVIGRAGPTGTIKPAVEGETPPDADAQLEREPDFMSQNIGSLSRTLARVSSERIIVRDNGDKVLQTVVYQWAK